MAKKKLRVDVGGDASGLQQTLVKSDRMVDRWAGGMKSKLATMFTAAALGYTLQNWTRKIVEYGSLMTDLAKQTGRTVKEVQQLDAVARKAGVSLEMMAKAFQNVEYKRGIALADPNSTAARAFAAFGFSGDKLRNADAGEIIKGIGSLGPEKLSQMTYALRLLFEEQGPKLVEAFALYASNEIQNLAVISDETAEALDAAADSFAEFKRLLIVEFAPAVAEASESLLAMTKAAKELSENKTNTAAATGTSFFGLAGLFGALRSTTIQDALSRAYGAGYEARLSAAGGRSQLGGPGAPAGSDITGEVPGNPKSRSSRFYSDRLTAVGNFLGASRDAVAQVEVQREQLKVAKQTLEVDQRIEDAIKEQTDAINRAFGGL